VEDYNYKSTNKILSNKDSQIIDLMRIFLVLIIIFIHILPFNASKIEFPLKRNDIYTFVNELFSHNIGYVANAGFFFLSGYFFFLKMYRFDTSFYKKQLEKRQKSLLLPYILWNVVMLIITIIVEFLKSTILSQPFSFSSYLNIPFLFETFKTPLNYPLWFIRDLIFLSILSPLYFIVFNYFKKFGLVLLLGIYLWDVRCEFLNDFGVGFFGFGAYLALKKKNIIHIFTEKNIRIISYIVALIGFTIATSINQTKFYILLIKIITPFGIIALINIAHRIYNNKSIRDYFLKLSKAAFFIIGLHMIYILPWMKGLLFKIQNLGNIPLSLFWYFITPVVVLFICYYLFIFAKKVFPKTVSLLNGGR